MASFRCYGNSDVIATLITTVFQGQYLPKFEHKLRRHKQTFGKIATTVVLDKDEKLL